MLSSEGLIAHLIARGFAVADMDKMSYGQLINFVYETDRLAAMARGEEVPDYEARYRQLKAAEPIIEERRQAGKITAEEYAGFKAALAEWEE